MGICIEGLRGWRMGLALGVLVVGLTAFMSPLHAARPQPPASADPMARMDTGPFASVRSGVLMAPAPKAGIGVASVTGDAAAWLVSEQLPNGAFPWTPGEVTAYRNTQGATALGLLRTYERNHDPALLQAAIANGDCQLANCLTGFDWGDGHHRFATHDPLFLTELST